MVAQARNNSQPACPRPRILLVDDDSRSLHLFGELLEKGLSSHPEVRRAQSASRALSLLETEGFDLMIVDLLMPRMDGLQLLSVVRRKYPHIRLVVLTGVREEHFRARAYALCADQYWIKPENDREMKLFLDSIESMLASSTRGGFRGVHSKSLVDIIQMECLCQNSCVLKVTNGVLEGRIWIQRGEVLHAQVLDLQGPAAFQRIMSWRMGSFEVLPADPDAPRTIETPYQYLLLDTAQAIDESNPDAGLTGNPDGGAAVQATTLLADACAAPGVEFAWLHNPAANLHQAQGVENIRPLEEWMDSTLEHFEALGQELRVGTVRSVIGCSPHGKVGLAPCGQARLGIGFAASTPIGHVANLLKRLVNKWAS